MHTYLYYTFHHSQFAIIGGWLFPRSSHSKLAVGTVATMSALIVFPSTMGLPLMKCTCNERVTVVCAWTELCETVTVESGCCTVFHFVRIIILFASKQHLSIKCTPKHSSTVHWSNMVTVPASLGQLYNSLFTVYCQFLASLLSTMLFIYCQFFASLLSTMLFIYCQFFASLLSTMLLFTFDLLSEEGYMCKCTMMSRMPSIGPNWVPNWRWQYARSSIGLSTSTTFFICRLCTHDF